MSTILLERNIITETELMEEIDGPAELISTDNEIPLFQEGLSVRIRSETSRLRWRRPHIRCPGYIFGSRGTVTRYLGRHSDPSTAAFRGPRRLLHLYSVSVPMANIWTYYSKPESHSPSLDSVQLEVYEDWLEPDHGDFPEPCLPAPPAMKEPEEQGVQDHDHDHQHGHDHSETRWETEQLAMQREQEGCPGKVAAEALRRLLVRKGVVSAEQLQQAVQRLEACGSELLGGLLAAQAWRDPEFKRRLLRDGQCLLVTCPS